MKKIFILKMAIILSLNALFLVENDAAQVIKKQTTVQILLNGVSPEEQKNINNIYVVGANGKIFLPYLKEEITAAGITSEKLARKIEEAYRKAEIYDNPRITVISAVEAAKPEPIKVEEIKLATIGGYINKPGIIQITKNMTLYTAIMAAGGPNTFGSLKRVELIRGEQRGIYDLTTKGDIKNKSIKVFEGDIINIPHKKFGE